MDAFTVVAGQCPKGNHTWSRQHEGWHAIADQMYAVQVCDICCAIRVDRTNAASLVRSPRYVIGTVPGCIAHTRIALPPGGQVVTWVPCGRPGTMRVLFGPGDHVDTCGLCAATLNRGLGNAASVTIAPWLLEKAA